MRDPRRIPTVLGAVERRWTESADEHLLPTLLPVTGAQAASQPDSLARVADGELIAALEREWHDPARSTPPVVRARPTRSELLAAITERWREEPDMRLGQLLVNVVRVYRLDVSPHPLFDLADGRLLTRLGIVTDDERRYVADEPAAARRGWREWSRQQGLA
jgi:uncharacterized protein YihD (DUF1040 family)